MDLDSKKELIVQLRNNKYQDWSNSSKKLEKKDTENGVQVCSYGCCQGETLQLPWVKCTFAFWTTLYSKLWFIIHHTKWQPLSQKINNLSWRNKTFLRQLQPHLNVPLSGCVWVSKIHKNRHRIQTVNKKNASIRTAKNVLWDQFVLSKLRNPIEYSGVSGTSHSWSAGHYVKSIN